jgi:hypothetical protein
MPRQKVPLGMETKEIDDYIKTKTLTEPTKKTYLDQYRILVHALGKPILDATEDEIIDTIKKIADTPNIQSTRVNVPLIIRRFNDKPFEKLLAYRNSLNEVKKTYTSSSLETKRDTLPSYDTLREYLDTLYKNNQYQKYIINYLLLNFCVRNKDCDVFITNKLKGDDINYLLLKKNQVEYIVNDYKTFKSYGKKSFTIKSKSFVNAIKNLPVDSWLLSTQKGEHIKATSLGKYLGERIPYGLGESDICKIVIQHLQGLPNADDALEFFSHSRGTSTDTLRAYYNLNTNHKVKHEDIENS